MKIRYARMSYLKSRKYTFTRCFYEAERIIELPDNGNNPRWWQLPVVPERGAMEAVVQVEIEKYVIKLQPWASMPERFLYSTNFNREHRYAFRGLVIRFGYDPIRKILVFRSSQLVPWE